MGILCKAATAGCVEIFEVSGICAGDLKTNGVLGDLNATALCRSRHHSFSWGRQRVAGNDGFERVVKTGRDAGGSVTYLMLISNRADYCGALISMPAGNQLLFEPQTPERHIPRMPEATADPYLTHIDEIN